MNSRASLLLICTLVLALLSGAWWMLRADGDQAPTTPGTVQNDPAPGPASPAVLPRPTESPGDSRAPSAAAPATPQVLSARGPALAQAAGRVIDRTGRPIPGASVTAFLSGPGQPYRTREDQGAAITSGTDGRFLFATLPVTSELGIEVEHADHAPVLREPFTIGAGELRDLGDILLEDGLLLLGTVTDDAGKPIEGAVVKLTDLQREQRGATPAVPLSALTDAEGNYTFAHLALRQYEVVADADAYAPVTLVLSMVLGTSDGRWRQDFRLEKADASLRGLVLDSFEKPVAGLTLRVSQRQRAQNTYRLQTTTTGADGRFAMSDMASGLYDIEVQSPLVYLDHTLQLPADGDEHTVRVQPALAVDGQLRCATTPPAEFSVRLRPDGRSGAGLLGTGPMDRAFRETSPPGSFVFDGLRPGSYRFEIYAEGFAVTTSSDVILGADVPVARLEVYLLRGGSVKGRVQPAQAGTRIELREADYDPSLSLESTFPTAPVHGLMVLTGADGSFLLQHVPPGTYTLSARPADAPPLHVRDVRVTDEVDTDVGALTLPLGCTLSGNVIGPDGRPRAGVRIGVTSAMHQQQTVTDGEGAFRMLALPPGEYDVVATPGNLWEALQFEGRAHVTLSPEQDLPVALTLAERSAQPR